MLFKGKIPVFFVCFFCKVWIMSKLSVLTCFTLNITRNYSWHFLFSWLLIVIIVSVSTRKCWRCTSFKGKVSVFSSYFTHKYWMTLKIYILTYFPLNIPRIYSWHFLFSLLLIAIISPVSMRHSWWILLLYELFLVDSLTCSMVDRDTYR